MTGFYYGLGLFLLAFASFWLGFFLCAVHRKPELDFSEMLRQVGGTDAEVALRAWRRGQPTFTIVAQDKIAPAVVAEWIRVANRWGVDQDKVLGAVGIMERIEKWPGEKKVPD